MKNVFVCGCIGFDSELFTKSYEEILLEIFENPSDYSIFVRIKVDTNLYICCSRMIEICYRIHRWFFNNKTCCKQHNMYVSCFDLLKYGFKSICNVCICPLQVKLLPFLIKIK